MAIAYVNGRRLRKAVIAAAQRVLETQERLNRINVFPVPDGDTGTNMALTLKSIAEAALNTKNPSLGNLADALAERALMGARGNSGAVLAQFFQGMAQQFAGKQRLDTKGFARAMDHAVVLANKAFNHPVEGTILSVMKAWSADLAIRASQVKDFSALWRESTHIAVKALQRTPKQLAVLAKAGVVDAGGQGFVSMLQGVEAFIESGDLKTAVLEEEPDTHAPNDLAEMVYDLNHPFCTECLVEGQGLNLEAIRSELTQYGDSLVVAGNATKIRIHIHTADPENIYTRASDWGVVSLKKADDMRLQSEAKARGESAKFALITDSSCDLPAEYFIQHKIRVVPLNLHIGKKTFLDRISITSDNLYKMMAEQDLRCQTSQPSPAAFRQAYALAAEQHETGLALLLTDALSGTYQAGNLAAKQEKRIQIETWNSRTIAAGLGFLVELAASAVEEGCDRGEVVRRLNIARPHVHLAVGLSTMKYLMRSGRVGSLRGFVAKALNLVPILGLDDLGKVKVYGKSRPGRKSRDKIFKLITRQTQGLEDVRIRVVHAGAEPEALQLADRFADKLKIDHIDVLPASPILGSHFGPGTVGAAWIGFPPGVKYW